MIRLKKILKISSFILLPLIIIWSMTFGWGWFVPYSLQPSYHEFKEMCKLNELPNDEHKYNKILSYFGLSLDTLDWEELNERSLKLIKGFNADYVKSKLEYRAKVTAIRKKRYNISVDLFANNKGLSKENITYIQIYGTWNTNRYFLEQKSMASYNLVWREKELSCTDIAPLKYDYAERIK
ncbi:hypothetical protein [Campylobacter jejuni]|uniref:hypothetical protein n=2 Tax=Campylobacter jejuni TaxID=197 RepID=UPI001642D93D|nr:hypothetical protein [Campylobacter jejuni]